MIESGSSELFELIKTADVDEVPDGWKTKFGWAEEWNVGDGYAYQLLSRGMKRGVVERKNFRIVVKGTPRNIPHYKQA